MGEEIKNLPIAEATRQLADGLGKPSERPAGTVAAEDYDGAAADLARPPSESGKAT